MVAIAACGGGGHKNAAATAKTTPAALVSQTVSASDAIQSGRISLSLDLALDGIKQLGGKPISLTVAGPFTRGTGGIWAALSANISAASSSATIEIDKVGKQIYVGIGGTFYDLSGPGLQGATTLPLRSTGASGASGAGGRRLFKSLGIDPKSWLTDPKDVGESSVGGVETEHLSAQINIAAVLNDLSKLIGASGSTGSGTSTSALELLQSAITSAHLDVYTGVSDHIVRRFDLAIAFSLPAIASGAIDGLTGGSLHLDATLTDLNQPQTITGPSSAQPSSKLLNGVFALESKFGSLASLVAGLTGGSGGSNLGGLLSGAGAASSSSSSSASSSG